MSGREYHSIPERITWTTGFPCATDKHMLGVLSTFGDFKTGRVLPVSLNKVIARARLPRRTVQRALHRLEAGGWIVADRRHRHATGWQITLTRLADNWVGARVLANLSATGGAQNPDLSATGGAQGADLSATGGAPFPCTYVPLQVPGAPAPEPTQLTFGALDLGGGGTAPTPTGDVWARVVERLERTLSRHVFYTWFGDAVLVEDRGGVLVVRLHRDRDQHELRAGWVRRHYADALAAAVARVRPGTSVEFLFAVRAPALERRRAGKRCSTKKCAPRITTARRRINDR